MDQSDLCFTSATELAALIRRGDLSPVQLVAAVLDRIERYDADLNAFCVVLAEQARNAAAMAERKVAQGAPLGPLHGVPVSIKDVTAVQGVALAMGSRALSGDVAAEDAVVVSRLREAGAIVIGKTTTPEFGCKAVTDSQLDGVTRNPSRRTHIAGGSSGGAAVAVASGMGPLAEGTDGAGSVRIPASCCGVVGMKPSLGRVPIYPRNGFETTSHEGPIARTVADAALMLDVISGPDHRDMFSLPASDTRFAHAVPGADVRGWRIAYAHSLDGNPVLAVVSELTDRAVARFVDCGADVVQDAPVIPDAPGTPGAAPSVSCASARLMGVTLRRRSWTAASELTL